MTKFEKDDRLCTLDQVYRYLDYFVNWVREQVEYTDEAGIADYFDTFANDYMKECRAEEVIDYYECRSSN